MYTSFQILLPITVVRSYKFSKSDTVILVQTLRMLDINNFYRTPFENVGIVLADVGDCFLVL